MYASNETILDGHDRCEMKAVLLNEIPRDEKLATEWNQLVFQMEAPEVFYTYDWALAVSQAFPDTLTPFLILLYENSSLLGVGSLKLVASERKVCFLAENTADYCDFVSRPVDRARVLEAVFLKLLQSGISEFVAANILSNSLTAKHLAAIAQKYGYLSVEVGRSISPIVVLKGSSEREQMRRALKRKRESGYARALAKRGQVHYRVAPNWPIVEADLFWKAYVARTVATKRVKVFPFAHFRTLVDSLSGTLAGRGWFSLDTLSLDGRSIAWGIYFSFLGKRLLYQCVFDSCFDRFNPGIILLLNSLNTAINDSSIQAMDLGIGDEQYKFRFANAERYVSRIVLTDDRLRYIKLRVRAEATELLKRCRTCENIARKILLFVRANRLARNRGTQF
jgi:CelD/BcsL family acetyltransferase involved in cellulose biosynthesis